MILKTGADRSTKIDLSGLGVGWHHFAFPDSMESGEWLRAKVIGIGALVDEVVVSGLNYPSDHSEKIVVSYPLEGECFDGEALVRGFVTAPSGKSLHVAGQRVELNPDGSFETKLKGEVDRAWTLPLILTGASPSTERNLQMQPCLSSSPLRSHHQSGSPDSGAPYSKVIGALGGTLAFGGVRLEVPSGALDSPTRLTIRSIPATEVEAMNPGMLNVTPGARAFRLAPHGIKFNVPIKLVLPVDEAALPPGGRKHHIGGFFYDDYAARWESIESIGEAQGDNVATLTDHFTDFVSATIASPDSPGTNSFTPTSMSGLDMASPASGVHSITPPTPNPGGAAIVQVPIQLPPGRAGMMPNLALNYSSSSGVSWVGQGWELGISRIEVDTRHGVPDYDGIWTQRIGDDNIGSRSGKLIFNLDGEQLTELTGSNGQRFQGRIAGALQRVTRRDAEDDASATYFEVTHQNGTKFIYGRTAAARLSDPAEPSHIARWQLEEVVDRFGNGILYEYAQETTLVGKNTPGSCSAADAVCSSGIYPERVLYTTHNGSTPGYAVDFIRSASQRTDVPVDGRFGFLVTDRYLLDEVKVSYVGDGSETPIRTYELTYEDGALHRPILTSVVQRGSQGTEFYRHTMSYSAAPSSRYSNSFEWTSLGQGSPTAKFGLDYYESKDERGGGGLGIFGREVIGGTGSTGKGYRKAAFVDMRGDGILDYYVNPGWYHSTTVEYGDWNLVGQPGGLDNGSTGNLPTASFFPPDRGMGQNKNSGWEFHGHLPGIGIPGFELTGSIGESKDKEVETLVDMNGDGLADLVTARDSLLTVYLNSGGQIDHTPIVWDGADFENARSVQRDADSEGAALANSFPVDPLVAWKAPFAGQIMITGEASRASEGDPVSALVHNRVGQVLWQHDFVSDASEVCGPTSNGDCGTGLSRQVEAGEWIYFRATAGAGAKNADVLWSPAIEYISSGTGEIRPYGLPAESYDFTQDFRVGGAPQPTWGSIGDGDVNVSVEITKGQSSDDLKVRVFKINISNPTFPNRLELPGLDWVVPTEAGSFSFDASTIPVSANDTLQVVLESDLMIDPLAIEDAQVIVSYETLHRVDPQDPQGPIIKRAVHCDDDGQGGIDCGVENDPTPEVRIPLSAIEQHLTPQLTIPVFESEPVSQFGQPNTQGAAAPSIVVSVQQNGLIRPGLVACQAGNVLLGKEHTDGTQGTSFFALGSIVPASAQPVACVYVASAWPSTGSSFPVVDFVPQQGLSGVPESRYLVRDVAFREHSGLEDDLYGRNFAQARSERSSLVGGFHRWFYGEWNGARAFDPAGLKANNMFSVPSSPSPQDQPLTALPIEVEVDSRQRWSLRGGAFIEAGRLRPSASVALGPATGSSSELEAIRKSRTKNYNITQSLVVAQLGFAAADTTLEQEFIDINGDRLPDLVNESGVQYNLGCQNSLDQEALRADTSQCEGGFTDRNKNFAADVGKSTTRISKLSAQGSYSSDALDLKMRSGSANEGAASAIFNANFSGGLNYGQTSTQNTMVDMNGDGLVDYVEWSSDARSDVFVRLNLGYKLAPRMQWDIDLSSSLSDSSKNRADEFLPKAILNATVDLSAEMGHYNSVNPDSPHFSDTGSSSLVGTLSGGGTSSSGWGGGIGVSAGTVYSINRQMSTFVDVTGDGRPDFVQKFPLNEGDVTSPLIVHPNLGHRFGPAEYWDVPSWGGATDGMTSNALYGLGYGNKPGVLDVLGFERSKDTQSTVNASVCYFFVCIQGSYTHVKRRSHRELSIADVNGDGYSDFVLKAEDDSGLVFTKLNQLAGANLLKTIEGPLGSEISIEYARQGHTDSDMLNHFVMKNSTVTDGRGASYVTTYEYEQTGRYDRDEREFFGFAKVVATRADGSKVTNEYENTNYYGKGLPLRTALNDRFDRSFVESTYEYDQPQGQLPLVGSHRPNERTRTSLIYEGASTPGKITRELRDWDPDHGNLVRYVIEGDEGTADDLIYDIDYDSYGLNSSVQRMTYLPYFLRRL